MALNLTLRSDSTIDVPTFVGLWPEGLIGDRIAGADAWHVGSHSSVTIRHSPPPDAWSHRFGVAYSLIMVISCSSIEVVELHERLAAAFPAVIDEVGGRGWVSNGDEAWFHWTDHDVTINTVLDERRLVHDAFTLDGRFHIHEQPITADDGYPDELADG